MYLYIKGLTSYNTSITGDDGKPNVKIVGSGSANVSVRDVVGNKEFCDACASLITSSKITVQIGSSTGRTLTAAEMTNVQDGSLTDLDSDGLADQAELKAGLKILGIDLKDTGTEWTAKLPGNGSGFFVPLRYYFVCLTGASLNGDATLNLGITTGGTELLNGATTVIDTADEYIRSDVTAPVASTGMIADNATLYANIASADTGTSGTMKLVVEGAFIE